MPSPGRKPIPTAAKILAGNPGHRALPKNEPAPAELPGGFEPALTPAALEVWREVVPPMIESGVMRSTDVLAAKLLCEQVAIYRTAHGLVRKSKTFASRKTGQVIPALTAMNKALSAVRALVENFGMTPSARVRVQAAPTGQNADEEEFFSAQA